MCASFRAVTNHRAVCVYGYLIHLQSYDPLVELGEEQGEDPDCVDGLEKLMVYINNALEDDGVRTDLVLSYTVSGVEI